MGAEQSALLASTQMGNTEMPIAMPNAELFFRSMYFDNMTKPSTGPITAALMHLVENGEARDNMEWTESDASSVNAVKSMNKSDASKDTDLDFMAKNAPRGCYNSDISDESNTLDQQTVDFELLDNATNTFHQYFSDDSDMELERPVFTGLEPIPNHDAVESIMNGNDDMLFIYEVPEFDIGLLD